MTQTHEILQIVNQELSATQWHAEPASLYDPIAYTMSMGGKHLRSALTLMGCNVFSEDLTPAIKPALGLEIFHNFTLLHDDIMDKAATRRGKPTVHIQWNENAAILSGDAMLIKAYQYIAQCPANVLPEVLSLFSQTAIEVCEGQQYDMNFETQTSVTEAEYLRMIELKTAVLLAASLKIGALIGGATPAQASSLYQFGIHIGIAFQLQDDYLDVYGDPAVFGKKIGGDISCNKKTFLLIRALANADATQKIQLQDWIKANPADTTEKIANVSQLYTNIGVHKECQSLMQSELDKAFVHLTQSCTSREKTSHLRNLASELMQREK